MRQTLCALLITIAVGAALPASAKEKKTLSPELTELVNKVDAKTATIETIKARFTQRKEVSLIKDPVIMAGDFFFKRKSGFRFNFDDEHDLLIVITNEETISVSHKAKKADRIKMKKRHGRLVERLLSDKIANLSKNFRIEKVTDASAGDGHHLVLTPTKRRLKKRFTDLQIWIDKDHLIYRLKVTKKDGDVYDLSLQDAVLNEEVPQDHFELEIPEEYEMGDRMEFLFGSGATL